MFLRKSLKSKNSVGIAILFVQKSQMQNKVLKPGIIAAHKGQNVGHIFLSIKKCTLNPNEAI